MKMIYADTFYWIALLSPRDQWYQRVLNHNIKEGQIKLVTTEGVLDELLNYFSKSGHLLRRKASQLYLAISSSPDIQLIAYTSKLRQAGFDLYQQRPDKGYSMTDCVSMILMKKLNIREVLTNDKHFVQEGFTILFPDL